MADETDQSEKTEDPTQKKLDDAHKKGDVAKSQEVNTWFSLIGATMIVMVFAPTMASEMFSGLGGIFMHLDEISLDSGGLRSLWITVGTILMATLGLPLLVMAVMAVAGNMVQHKIVLSAESLKPKFSKISPAAGFKRLFSKDSLVNFGKGVVKITIVGSLMVLVLWPERDRLDTMIMRDVLTILPEAREIVLKLLAAVVAIMTVVAGLDLFYQRNKWFEKQKMTMQEIKDEYKQTEGDPMVKGKIRQIRMERSRKRMMAAVPSATVVVTNPTHYAVALKYDEGMPAPLCVAKGTDATALKIREVAKGANVPIIENPPLARSLYAQVDIDVEIPEEHYRAVAEVIGFVMRQRKKPKWRS